MFDKTKWATLKEICDVYGVITDTFFNKLKKHYPARLCAGFRKKIIRNGARSFIYRKDMVIDMFEKFPPWERYKVPYTHGKSHNYLPKPPEGFVTKKQAIEILNETEWHIRAAITRSVEPIERVYVKENSNNPSGKKPTVYYNLKQIKVSLDYYLAHYNVK